MGHNTIQDKHNLLYFRKKETFISNQLGSFSVHIDLCFEHEALLKTMSFAIILLITNV